MTDCPFEDYDDIKVGVVKKSPPYHIGLSEITGFATQWDPAPFHLDVDSAQARGFENVFASGVHLLAICVKLCNEIKPQPEFVAGLAWDDIRFIKPVYAGETVHAELRCLNKRRSSAPGRAVLEYEIRLLDSRGECAVQYNVKALVTTSASATDAN